MLFVSGFFDGGQYAAPPPLHTVLPSFHYTRRTTMNLVPRRSLFDFDDLFDVWGPHRGAEATKGAFMPRVDIKDKKDCYEITAELPGVKKKISMSRCAMAC